MESAWLCDHPTQTSFPGSHTDTQASTFRFRRLHTQQRSAALLEHHSITGVSRDFHEQYSFRLIATSESSQPFQTIPYSGGQIPDDLSVSRNEGCLSQRCSSIPFGNHAWTLSSRTTTAMRSRLCPTLLGELSGQRLTRSVNVLPRYKWPTRRPRFNRTLSIRRLVARFIMIRPRYIRHTSGCPPDASWG